jgi:hypothetical protein
MYLSHSRRRHWLKISADSIGMADCSKSFSTSRKYLGHIQDEITSNDKDKEPSFLEA